MSKKYDNLFDKIVDEKNFDDAYKKTQKAQLKYKISALKFSEDLTDNLNRLRNSLIDGSYKPGNYHSFMVHEPKERIIFAPEFEDKIVQHTINNVLRDIYENCFIYDSYACIRGKGTHKAVERIQHFIRRSKWESPDSYFVKVDISKFFYNIDRQILKSILRKKIKCERTLWLLDALIDSSPGEIGLPLGNLTSQLFANIYLNELDQFCKRILKVKHYIRYADDMVMIVRNKNVAKDVLSEIREYTSKRLNLTLHPYKSKIFPEKQGVNAIGFKSWSTHRLLRNDCKKKVKRKVKAMPRLIENGRMSREKAEQMLNSWLGHARHGNSFNFIMGMLMKRSYLSLINGKFIISIEGLK